MRYFALLVLDLACSAVLSLAHGAEPASPPQELRGTQPLTESGDLAERMVAGIDQYLMRAIAASIETRQANWRVNDSSLDGARKLVEQQRARLKKILGVVDPRVTAVEMEFVSTTQEPSWIAETEWYRVHAVRWPALAGVDAEGLLLEPKGKPRACVVALPDSDWTPEMLVGLAPVSTNSNVPEQARFVQRLAENGCRVLVPTLIDRRDTWSGDARLGRLSNQPHREFIYRMAYEMGRHIIGYEVQKVLAAVDWFCREKDHPLIGVYGYGEGGAIAFYSGAVDERIGAACVSGYFGPREQVWQEPIYRNVFGLLTPFGDAEVAAWLYRPTAEHGTRRLLIVNGPGPEIAGPPSRQGHVGAAPGRLASLRPEETKAEYQRVEKLRGGPLAGSVSLAPRELDSLESFLNALGVQYVQTPPARLLPTDRRAHFDPVPRQHRQFKQLVAFTQALLPESRVRRQESFWSQLDLSSPEKYVIALEPHRRRFYEDVIGKLPEPSLPVNPRTRLIHDEPKWNGYEVMLDLYPDVFAYGILLVPKDVKPGERRPVVVCQHGLEGRPQDVVNPTKRTPFYASFGAQLADRGYIVYAPQNPYIGQDKFRVLQRKANPLQLSLFSFIVRQHERTLDWLATLPMVDPERLAFYGLSYGGKTAMRVPALLPRYCLSICSGDFNEWIWKNINLEWRNSYIWVGEYEMFEFDLGNTFNYAEMAALIAPRPFMVERGHDDGVGLDEWVAFEYAKVRRLYDKLGMGDRTAIEFFNGGHIINGKGTFAFLDKHLRQRR